MTLALAFVPQKGQLALLRGSPLGRDRALDAQALPRALAALAARHGVDFQDASTALASYPAPAELYYPVDGHPTGMGDRVIADAIARRYTAPGEPFAAYGAAPARRQRTANR